MGVSLFMSCCEKSHATQEQAGYRRIVNGSLGKTPIPDDFLQLIAGQSIRGSELCPSGLKMLPFCHSAFIRERQVV